jgi:RNA polymerase sigma-70 factor (ECF subfamily)
MAPQDQPKNEGAGIAGSVPAADETVFLKRLRGGDAAAFEQLVREAGPRMLVVARRFLRSESDAQDAVQEAFLSAFKALGGFDAQARLSTWLHRIVVNVCLMRLRTAKRHPEVSIEGMLPAFVEDGHQRNPAKSWNETPEVIIQRLETRALVRSSIDQLPEMYRAVLLLRDIEGFDTQETANMLELNANTVKIRLHRARQALREMLDPHMRSGALGGDAGASGGGRARA